MSVLCTGGGWTNSYFCGGTIWHYFGESIEDHAIRELKNIQDKLQQLSGWRFG